MNPVTKKNQKTKQNGNNKRKNSEPVQTETNIKRSRTSCNETFEESVLRLLGQVVERMTGIEKEITEMKKDIANMGENIKHSEEKETIIGSVNPVMLNELGLPAKSLSELSNLESRLANEDYFEQVVSLIYK